MHHVGNCKEIETIIEIALNLKSVNRSLSLAPNWLVRLDKLLNSVNHRFSVFLTVNINIASCGIITMCMHAKSLQLCLTLCNPMDCVLSGSSVHSVSQARVLEWVAMPSSRGSF